MIRPQAFYCFFLLLLHPTLGFSDPLIHEARAQAQGLTRAWFSQAQLDRSQDKIESVTLDRQAGEKHGILFLQTQLGTIQAFDSETGEVLWVNHVGSPQHPTMPIGVGPNHVAVLNGSDLYVFDRLTGKFILKKQMEEIVGGGPGLSKELAFVPCVNGVLEAISLEKEGYVKDNNADEKEKDKSLIEKQRWKHMSHAPIMVQPRVTPSVGNKPEHIGWSNNYGNFYVASVSPMEMLYFFPTRDRITAPPAYTPPNTPTNNNPRPSGHFYLGSLNGYLYKIQETTGNVIWRFPTGQPILYTPLAVGDRIYVATEHGELYCVMDDITDGSRLTDDANSDSSDNTDQQIWRADDITRVLAATPERVFGLDNLGNVRILNSETGRNLGMLQTEDVSFSVINHVNDRIYLVTDTGVVQCLHDRQHPEPHYHFSDDSSEKGKKPDAGDRSDSEFENGLEDGPDNQNGGDNPFENNQDSGQNNGGGEENDNPFE
jgi:hypothetical protein